MTSERYLILGNRITDNGQRGISFRHTTTCYAEGNVIADHQENVYFTGRSFATTITENDLLDSPVITFTDPGHDQNAADNWRGTTDADEIDELVVDGRNGRETGLIRYEPWLNQPSS